MPPPPVESSRRLVATTKSLRDQDRERTIARHAQRGAGTQVDVIERKHGDLWNPVRAGHPGAVEVVGRPALIVDHASKQRGAWCCIVDNRPRVRVERVRTAGEIERSQRRKVERIERVGADAFGCRKEQQRLDRMGQASWPVNVHR